MKKILMILIMATTTFMIVSCKPKEKPKPTPPDPEENESYREGRKFEELEAPSNEIEETSLPKLTSAKGTVNEDEKTMISSGYQLKFIKETDQFWIIIQNKTGKIMFENEFPVEVYIRTSKSERYTYGYDSITKTDFGFLAKTTFDTKLGTTITVEDRYYFPKENESGVFNVRRAVITTNINSGDKGFSSVFTFGSTENNQFEFFVPSKIFKDFPTDGTNRVYRETQLGVPMIMIRNTKSGDTLSLSRYQPIVSYKNDSFASFEVTNEDLNKNIAVTYPSKDSTRRFHDIKEGTQHVYDLSIRTEVTVSYDDASVSTYNAHFNLQNPRVVDTDIDEVYKVINEDYKVFLHEVNQVHPETGKKYKSYGLPWRITIEDGEFGPLTYQAGFIGQQLPSAYNMMLYGVINNDLKSFENGLNVLDFWVNDAEFMTLAGVPYIWYDTWSDDFRRYPAFTRMAVDAMEGLLDGYRLATAHGINRPEWLDAIEAFGNFLVNNQNVDGSYYRVYNYDGGPFNNWDNGIEEPPNNITQSYSKANTTMPVRYLGKMFELTGDVKYKEAAIKAGDYIFNELYPSGYYQGGTADNPNAIDKEAGVYAMYAYDTLYMLTKDDKWIKPLVQATAFTMSNVQIFSFGTKKSNLKASYPLYYGYNDGMSFITAEFNGIDNYLAYIYFQLFRVYIITGEKTYLKQAEFIQQNTKSIMNWDGLLNYKYKSLVAEASTIYQFGFHSASDGAWVTWSSVANVEPIAKMLTNFGKADVMDFKDTDINELRQQLDVIGIGGKPHKVYENTILEKFK